MASEPISALTQTSSPSANNIVPIVFNGVTQSISISSLVTSASAALYGAPAFIRSGDYLSPPGSFGGSAITQNTLYATPIILSQPATLTGFAIQVTSAAVSGVILGSVYTATTGNMPGNLLSSSTVTFPATSVAAPFAAFASPIYFSPGVYWFTTVSQNSVSVSLSLLISFSSLGLPQTAVSNQSVNGYAMTGVSGSLPTTYTISSALTSVPRVWVKFQ
jgi:hypothetical protein